MSLSSVEFMKLNLTLLVVNILDKVLVFIIASELGGLLGQAYIKIVFLSQDV